MLILVGVTVTVALNGGLFEKAREGAKGTTIAREKEELTLAVATAYDVETGKINFTELEKNLPTSWSGTKGNYTSGSENKFTVYKNGDIVEGEIITEEEIRQLIFDIAEGGLTVSLEKANELKTKLKLSDKYNETDIFCTFTLPSEYNLKDEDIACFYIYPLDRFFIITENGGDPVISETEEEYYLEFARKLYDIKQEIESYFKGHSKEEIFSKQETLAQEILQKSNDILGPLEFRFDDEEDIYGTYSLKLYYSWNENTIHFSRWNTMYFVLNEDNVYLGAYIEIGC